MDDPLRIIAEEEGVFLYREAIAAGYKDRQIQAMRRRGEWHRVRHGAYCFGDVWRVLTPEQKHLTLAHAVRRTTPGPIAFSHTTALVAHGIAVWNANLEIAHVSRLDGAVARRLPDVRHHVGRGLREDDLTEVGGLLVTRPARALLEAGTILSTESSLVSFDSAVWKGLCGIDELRDLFLEKCNHWPGSGKLHISLRLVTGKSETPGESRSMFMFWRHGLPKPEQQWEVRLDGVLIAVLDFAWPWLGVFGEFDGMRKYFRDLRPGQRPEDVIVDEKKREDLVRRITNWRGFRIIWPELDRPRLIVAQLRPLFTQRTIA